MTRLFGGFGRAFYDAYESAWPLEAGADGALSTSTTSTTC
jgi:fructosamine-3-kinase